MTSTATTKPMSELGVEKRLMELEKDEWLEDGAGSPQRVTVTFRELLVPLNLKHLTIAHLKRLASKIGVSPDAAGEEVHQMIEGKLLAMGWEPRDVQVILGETPHDEFRLQNMTGTILTVKVEKTNGEPSSEEDEDDDKGAEMKALCEELESVKLQNTSLLDELDQEKQRMLELWRTNCQCLAEYDRTRKRDCET